MNNINEARQYKVGVVGGAGEEFKEKASREIHDSLFDHLKSLPKDSLELLKREKIPLTETERRLINFANAWSNALMKMTGRKPYDIPLENYHKVPGNTYREEVTKTPGSTGIADYHLQGAVFNADEVLNPLGFAMVAMHETLHLKGRLAIEAEESTAKNEPKNPLITKTLFRAGVSVYSAQKSPHPHRHFRGLNEAIVGALEKAAFKEIIELPELARERMFLESETAQKIKKVIAQSRNIPEDEICLIILADGKYTDHRAFPYFSQRQTLSYVCEEIQKQFPDKYQAGYKVFEEFYKAHFTGRLLPVARLVEETFGKGSFRVLGNMTDEHASGVLHLETMKRLRLRQIIERRKD